MVWAYSPEGSKAAPTPERAPLPASTAGLRIALLDNRKANAGALLESLGSSLVERLGASVAKFEKPNASVAASAELLDRIRGEADFVISASSD